MGRGDPGMALFVDWAGRKNDILEEAQAGWPKLAGNQVYLDLTVDGRSEQTMRLVFGLFLEQVRPIGLLLRRSAWFRASRPASRGHTRVRRCRSLPRISTTCARTRSMGSVRLAIRSGIGALRSTGWYVGSSRWG